MPNFTEKPTSKLKKHEKAEEIWTEEQCQGNEENLQKNNSKNAYQLAEELTSLNGSEPEMECAKDVCSPLPSSTSSEKE